MQYHQQGGSGSCRGSSALNGGAISSMETGEFGHQSTLPPPSAVSAASAEASVALSPEAGNVHSGLGLHEREERIPRMRATLIPLSLESSSHFRTAALSIKRREHGPLALKSAPASVSPPRESDSASTVPRTLQPETRFRPTVIPAAIESSTHFNSSVSYFMGSSEVKRKERELDAPSK